MSGVYEQRDRAESFGRGAERYDRTRPTYPAAMVEWLSSAGAGRAVDVGCGTGQLARLLIESGWATTGVEADDRMAEVARSHGVTVEVATFEEWTGPTSAFDLVSSAQAWHWIDPKVGYAKAASHLVPGGRLAMIWNSYRHTDAVRALLHDVVGRHAPEVLEHSVQFGTAMVDHDAEDALVQRHIEGLFDDMTVQTFEHERRQSVDEWTEECLTHSPIALLDAEVRGRLLDDQRRALLDTVGPSFVVGYTARATSVRKL